MYRGLQESGWQQRRFTQTWMKRWRICEATLLLLAVLGGSIGAWIGMKVWHHKTMHKKFKYGIPAILLIQIALMAYLHMN